MRISPTQFAVALLGAGLLGASFGPIAQPVSARPPGVLQRLAAVEAQLAAAERRIDEHDARFRFLWPHLEYNFQCTATLFYYDQFLVSQHPDIYGTSEPNKQRYRAFVDGLKRYREDWNGRSDALKRNKP